MSISEKIDRILVSRKEKVEKVRERINVLENAIGAARTLMEMKNEVVYADGDRMDELITGSKYFSFFHDNRTMLTKIGMLSPHEFIIEANELLEKYKEIEECFSRDCISIALVGECKQGKTRFLQTVSGLDNECIPGFDGGFSVGGAIVENSMDEGIQADIVFKTEREIVAEVNSYFARINKNKRISRMSEISELELDDIWDDNAWNALTVWFDEWQYLIGGAPITLTDKNEIMEYVAWYNGEFGEHREKFYKFVAVKSVKVRKRFKYDDIGKIRLIDTAGFRGGEMNIDTKTLDTIRKQSDAVVFFIKPWCVDMPPIVQCLENQFRSRNMDKWFVYLINHFRSSGNIKVCQHLHDYLNEQKSITGHPHVLSKIVDVANHEEVRDKFLIPLLTELTDNLEDLDNILIEDTIGHAKNVGRKYDELCTTADEIIASAADSGVFLLESFCGGRSDFIVRF